MTIIADFIELNHPLVFCPFHLGPERDGFIVEILQQGIYIHILLLKKIRLPQLFSEDIISEGDIASGDPSSFRAGPSVRPQRRRGFVSFSEHCDKSSGSGNCRIFALSHLSVFSEPVSL
jgi:hypothetical protein